MSKILHACTGLPPDREGGVETIVSNAARELSKRGHQVGVVTRFWRTRVQQENVYQLRTLRGEAPGYASWGFGAWREVRNLKPEVVHCHGLEGAILCNILQIAAVKKVMHIHNSLSRENEFFSSWNHRIGYEILKRSCHSSDAIICPTEVVKSDILRHSPTIGESKIRVIPNMVEANKVPEKDVSNLKEKLGLDGKKVILYFGKVKRTKGIEDICRAYELLARDDVSLVVAGSPTRTDNFLNYLRIRYPSVIFTGYVEDKSPFFQMADLFCIYTSGFDGGETFAMALAEAMSYGVPIVCADNPIFREVTGGNAYIAPPNSPAELAKSFNLALDNYHKSRKRAKEASKVALQYSSQNFTNKIEEVYHSVLG